MNFYPRPPRGGRPERKCPHHSGCPISIHALREEGDPALMGMHPTQTISIHALREEGDHRAGGCTCPMIQFLSTPSARRATAAPGCSGLCSRYFYPRPPRSPGKRTQVRGTISIHALREEGDMGIDIIKNWRKEFLSTPSARRATRKPRRTSNPQKDFYPRPPRGGRRKRGNQ